jgi:hypothetical protein
VCYYTLSCGEFDNKQFNKYQKVLLNGVLTFDEAVEWDNLDLIHTLFISNTVIHINI